MPFVLDELMNLQYFHRGMITLTSCEHLAKQFCRGDAHPRVIGCKAEHKAFDDLQKAKDYMEENGVKQPKPVFKEGAGETMPLPGNEAFYAVANGRNLGIYPYQYVRLALNDKKDYSQTKSVEKQSQRSIDPRVLVISTSEHVPRQKLLSKIGKIPMLTFAGEK